MSADVADEILSFFRRCIGDLSQRIGGPDAEARAFQIMATLEGAMMLARVYRAIEAFDQAAAGLMCLNGNEPSATQAAPRHPRERHG